MNEIDIPIGAASLFLVTTFLHDPPNVARARTPVDWAGIIGYYTLIGNTLNVFRVPLPEGETLPFPE